MGTYHNGYDILSDVRDSLNENDDVLVKGTATYGKYSNTFIMKSVNRAQRVIYAKLFIRLKESFLTSVDVTGVASVFALPWDFGTMRRFEDESGAKVSPMSIDHRPGLGNSGSRNNYYRKGNNLVVNRSGVTDTYTLWYLKKPREIEQGLSTGSNTLAATAKVLADYYNGLILENVTDSAIYNITDYSAVRVVTLESGTLATDKYYGTVSDLEEPFHHLIAPLAAMIAKADHPVAPEKPSQSSLRLWKGELDDAILAFGGRQGDILEEDLWTDFNNGGGYTGVLLPGH